LSSAETAPAPRAALVSQAQIDRAYTQDKIEMIGELVPTEVYLDTVARLASMVRRFALVADLSSMPRLTQLAHDCGVVLPGHLHNFRDVFTDPADAACMMAFTTEALSARDLPDFEELLEGLPVPANAKKRARTAIHALAHGLPAPIAEVFARRASGPRGRLLTAAPETPTHFRTDQIPQAVPWHLESATLRSIANQADVPLSHLRVLASATAALLATGATWSETLHRLDVPWSVDHFVYPTIAKLDRAGVRQELRDETRRLLDCYVSIDDQHGNSRRRWAQLRELPDELVATPGSEWKDHRWLTSQVWAHLTGGIAELAPGRPQRSVPRPSPLAEPTNQERQQIRAIARKLKALRTQTQQAEATDRHSSVHAAIEPPPGPLIGTQPSP
jgi:hypothetical protein